MITGFIVAGLVAALHFLGFQLSAARVAGLYVVVKVAMVAGIGAFALWDYLKRKRNEAKPSATELTSPVVTEPPPKIDPPTTT